MTEGPLLATCHCGAVRLEADMWPAAVTSCNCSICRRYGALWAYYTRASARLASAASALSVYTWGDKLIEFCHCGACGCVTHWESIDKQPSSRLAINARLLAPDVLATIPVRTFDGAASWRYLDE